MTMRWSFLLPPSMQTMEETLFTVILCVVRMVGIVWRAMELRRRGLEEIIGKNNLGTRERRMAEISAMTVTVTAVTMAMVMIVMVMVVGT